MAARRTAEEIQELLEGYRQRRVTRAEYCRQRGIAKSTLDYYQRRYRQRPARLARVKIAPAAEPATGTPFTIVLRNGRRIESGWDFRDAALTRLIRVAEAE